jgi:hypothetical protein
MSYLFNEAIPFGGTGGQFCGKNKGVLMSCTTTGTVDLFTYKANGTTAATRIQLAANDTTIIPIRVWGVSCGAVVGFTGAVIS